MTRVTVAFLALVVAFAAHADSIFMSDERGDDLGAISATDHRVVAAIPVGKRPGPK